MSTTRDVRGEPLPWLATVWERLGLARDADRLPHGLLICGPRGLGKRLLADRLGRGLLCGSPLEDGAPCGACRECRLTGADSHPDLIRIGPDPESKSGEVPVDAIRVLGERMALSAGVSGRRVAIIDPADRMNAAASNALLKTLEEPPPGAHLILIAEQPSRLPATIRSRCQIVRIHLPPRDESIAWLVPRLGAEAAELHLALAHGAPLCALDGIDPETLERRRALIASLLGITRGERDPVAEAKAWDDLGADVTLTWLAGWLCDLIRLQAAGEAARVDGLDSRQALDGLAGRIDGLRAHRLLKRSLEARGLLDANINPLLTIESLLIDWSRLVRRGTYRVS